MVSTTIDHIIDLFPIYPRVTLHEGFNRHSAKVIGTDRCKTTGITAEWSTDGIDDISVFHSNFCPLLQAFLAILRRYFTVATWMSPRCSAQQGGCA
ncbi:Uncharacterised protein [Acinetobacter baumannii]|nr:Uncharacterised protein [Acinetobacter baumannii]